MRLDAINSRGGWTGVCLPVVGSRSRRVRVRPAESRPRRVPSPKSAPEINDTRVGRRHWPPLTRRTA